MSRFAYSTRVPAMVRIEIRLSPFRVTYAFVPSGEMATWAGTDSGGPRSTRPAGLTVLPAIVKTDTVPSKRLATSASVPAGLIDTPDAPLPACSVASTFTGDAWRSITVSRLSGTVLVGSAGSIFVDAVTSAID